MAETLAQLATILLDRIEAHDLDLSRRLCVFRQSGGRLLPIELPVDLEALVGITQGFLAATPLTDDGITGRVNETGANRTLSSGINDPFPPMMTIIPSHDKQQQLAINRLQAETIANLVQLLMQSGVNHADVQRITDTGINSDDAGDSA